jgi:hypothetical protein
VTELHVGMTQNVTEKSKMWRFITYTPHLMLSDDSGLLRCDNLSFDEHFPTFRTVLLPSSSGTCIQIITELFGILDPEDDSNMTHRNSGNKPPSCQCRIQKVLIFSITAVRISTSQTLRRTTCDMRAKERKIHGRNQEYQHNRGCEI